MRNLPQLEKTAQANRTPEIEPQGTQPRPERKLPSSARKRQKEKLEEHRASQGDTWSRSGGNYYQVF